MDNQVKTREWVKTAAIIFLAVLLVLTFFSNTILNASLKPVMGQAVQSGSIKARISGQGRVKADETYDVTVNQTRKVASVKIKVGSKVEVGDVLFVLEPRLTRSSGWPGPRDRARTAAPCARCTLQQSAY